MENENSLTEFQQLFTSALIAVVLGCSEYYVDIKERVKHLQAQRETEDD